MFNRFSRVLALVGVSAVMAIGGVGIAQASPDHHGKKHDVCKRLHGKRHRECEKKHHREKKHHH